MEPIKCDRCYKRFSRSYIPKILGCGHTFCHVCITDFIYWKTSCRICSAPITKLMEEYQTNMIVLNYNYRDKLFLSSDSQLRSTLLYYKEQLSERQSLMEKSMDERMSQINVITKKLERIYRILEMGDLKSPKKVNNLIWDLKYNSKRVHATFLPELLSIYYLNENENPSLFLNNLSFWLGERKIYAYVISQDFTLKYGKMAVEENIIYVSAFTKSEIEEDSYLVSFEDLKKCITVENFRTYMKMAGRTLFFSITDSSFLASLFVKLCSGEHGPLFRNANFERCEKPLPLNGNAIGTLAHSQTVAEKKNVCVTMLETKDVYIEQFRDYDFSIFATTNKTNCSVGDIIVQMNPNGSCTIHKCATELCFDNVVAKVLDQPNEFSFILNYLYFKVMECGVSFIYEAC